MQRKYNLTHFILTSVVVLGLTLLMVCVDAQARIAFVSDRDENWEIYVMDTDGNNQQRLTNNRKNDWDPSWSPDGTCIVFISQRDGNFEIYVMDTEAGNERNLTKNLNDDRDPSWSPDGERIVFASDRDKKVKNSVSLYEIYVMDTEAGNERNLTKNLNDDRYPSWSPDGERIVFSSRRDGHFRSKFGITSEIYVMDADGQNQQRLTNNRRYDRYPSWSPDGKRITFASDRRGDLGNFEIYVMDADGQNQQRLTNNPFSDRDPSWSPDGKHITFTSYRDHNKGEIYVMDADGNNQRNLTNNPHNDSNPAWYNPAFAVTLDPVMGSSQTGKILMIWGGLKQINR